MPGLLQTPAYARALLRVGHPGASEEEIEDKLAARLSRQERLLNDRPPRLWGVMDEAVVRRQVGGPEVLREQLASLLPLVETAHTTLQVMPFSGGEHACLGGSLILLDLPGGVSVAYQEGLKSAQLSDDNEAVA